MAGTFINREFWKQKQKPKLFSTMDETQQIYASSLYLWQPDSSWIALEMSIVTRILCVPTIDFPDNKPQAY